jgi:hypothetical protein
MNPAIQPPIVLPDPADFALDREVRGAQNGDLGADGEPGEEQDYRDLEVQNEDPGEAEIEAQTPGAEPEAQDDAEEDMPSGARF